MHNEKETDKVAVCGLLQVQSCGILFPAYGSTLPRARRVGILAAAGVLGRGAENSFG